MSSKKLFSMATTTTTLALTSLLFSSEALASCSDLTYMYSLAHEDCNDLESDPLVSCSAYMEHEGSGLSTVWFIYQNINWNTSDPNSETDQYIFHSCIVS